MKRRVLESVLAPIIVHCFSSYLLYIYIYIFVYIYYIFIYIYIYINKS